MARSNSSAGTVTCSLTLLPSSDSTVLCIRRRQCNEAAVRTPYASSRIPRDSMRERVAVVTGAGRGIGRAYALRMAAYGARVVVNDAGVATDGGATDEDPAAEVVAEIEAAGGEAVAHRGDIGDARSATSSCSSRSTRGAASTSSSTTRGSAGRAWCSTSPTTSGTT